MISTILSSFLMFGIIVPSHQGSNITHEEQISASDQVLSHHPQLDIFQHETKKDGNGDDDPIVPPNRR